MNKNIEKEKTTALKELGLKIAKARLSKGYNQYELSRMLGRNRSFINHIETGSTNISYYSLLEICESLGITLKQLLDL